MPSPFVLLKEYSYKEILISNRKILKCQQNYAFLLCYNVLIFQRWDSSEHLYIEKDHAKYDGKAVIKGTRRYLTAIQT